jgi:exodeoxyribonuclease X
MTVRVIDVETTGLDPQKDSVIEIASIDLTKDGFTNPMQTFVALPSGSSGVPSEASALHGIIDADLVGAPPFREAMSRFAGADLYVSHNAGFEMARLPDLGPWVCTFKAALRVWPEAPAFSNGALRYWLGHVNPLGVDRHKVVAHRAPGDVLMTGAVFLSLLQSGAKMSDLRAWTAEPAAYPRFTFGKHKGQKVADTPTDYLEWLAFKATEVEGDWKLLAAAELKRRRR